MNLSDHKTQHYYLAATLVLAFLLLFWDLGALQLMSLNEGRRALAIREMYESANWLVPTLNGELYLTKPPLMYWFSAAIAKLFGNVSEWTLRLPSAISALIILVAGYRYVKQRFGFMHAWFSVQVLMANLGFIMLARRAEIEMMLAMLCFLSLLAALTYLDQPTRKIWARLSYFLLGLAVLTKGPVALLFVTLPLLATYVWSRNQELRQLLLDGAGWLIFLMVSLSWYAAVSWVLGFDIWQSIINQDIVNKVSAAKSADPLLSYPGWIIVDFLFLVGLFLIRPAQLFRTYSIRLDFRVIVMAAVLPLMVFSIFASKHAKYLLPIYPWIAIMLGIKLAQIFDSVRPLLKRLLILLLLMLPLSLAVFYMFAEQRVFWYRTAVFSELPGWLKTTGETRIYTLEELDSRVIYYAGLPVSIIDENAFKHKLAAGERFIILSEAEGKKNDRYMQASACRLKTFTPYLKKRKTLNAYGFGDLCPGRK